MSPIVKRRMASSLAVLPPPTRQKSFSGRCVHSCRQILQGDTDVLLKEGAAGGSAVSIVGYDLFGGRFSWKAELQSE